MHVLISNFFYRSLDNECILPSLHNFNKVIVWLSYKFIEAEQVSNLFVHHNISENNKKKSNIYYLNDLIKERYMRICYKTDILKLYISKL